MGFLDELKKMTRPYDDDDEFFDDEDEAIPVAEEPAEKTDPAVARRLIDFLSGVAYAQDGKIRRVASSTYIITPFNVDLMGDQLDDMESGEFHL